MAGVPHGMIGQLVRFGIIGVASTVAYALLYLVLHPMIGAQAANFAGLLITAILNTAANRASLSASEGPRARVSTSCRVWRSSASRC